MKKKKKGALQQPPHACSHISRALFHVRTWYACIICYFLMDAITDIIKE